MRQQCDFLEQERQTQTQELLKMQLQESESEKQRHLDANSMEKVSLAQQLSQNKQRSQLELRRNEELQLRVNDL